MVHRKSQRVISVLMAILAFLMFCCGPLVQSAQAIVLVDDAFIAILIAALAACGIAVSSSEAYGSLTEYMGNMLSDCAEYNNTTVSGLVRGCQSGANKTGYLLINNRFVQLVQTLGAYLKYRYTLQDNTTVTLQYPSTSVGELTAYLLPFSFKVNSNSVRYEYYVIRGSGARIIWTYSTTSHNTLRPIFVSSNPCIIEKWSYWTESGDEQLDQTIELEWEEQYQKYYATTGSFLTSSYDDITNNCVIYENAYAKSALRGEITDPLAEITGYIGEQVLPHEDEEYQAGCGAILDVGARWGAGYGEITYGVIPNDYTFGRVGTATIEYVLEDEVEDEIEDYEELSVNPDDYAVNGLQEIFPFCIPFDLYNFVEALDATPEAPVINWRFYVPGICDETIEIDLSVFDTVAQILRTMELLLFCVGLAFVTRKIIRG